MSFTNEISFDQELVKGHEVKINYNGYLAKNGASSVTLVYGYDSDWKETDSAPMIKVEKGFELALKIKPYDEFNYCFRDDNNNWDNNYGNNFSAKINVEAEAETTSEVSEEEAIQAEEIRKIEEEISNLFDELFNTEEEEKESNVQLAEAADIVTPVFGEEEKQESNVQEFNLDELIDKILTPITNNDVTIPVYVPVSETNTEQEFSNIEDINSLVESILNREPETNVNIDLEQYNSIINDLENNSQQIVAESAPQAAKEIVAEEVEVKPAKIAKKDFTIIEEEKQELEEEISLVESQLAEEKEKQEELSLVVTDDDNDLVASRKLSKIYRFIKRIRLAFAKLFYNRFNSKQED